MKVGGELMKAGADFSTIRVRQHITEKEAFALHVGSSGVLPQKNLGG